MTYQDAESIGSILRASREDSGVSLRQIADATKLSVRTLEALESDRVNELPGGIYRRAVVRHYAREVGLDPEATLGAFLARHPDDLPALPPPSRKPSSYDPPPPAPPPARARSRGIAALLSVIGALIPIAAGAFYLTISLRGEDVPRDVADVTPRASDVWRPDLVPAAGFTEAPPRSSPVAVMITVSSPCGLQVMADGREVVSRTMAPGEQLQLALNEELVLSGDDAGAVHISMNGRALRSLGAAGAALDVRIGRDDYGSWIGRP